MDRALYNLQRSADMTDTSRHYKFAARKALLVSAVPALLVAVAGCEAGSGHANDMVAATLGKHLVFLYGPARSTEAAAWYALQGPDRVVLANEGGIDVLRATGTTWHGEIIVRISQDTGANGEAVSCYRYDLHHSRDDATPHRVPCPAFTPISLPSPPPLPVVDAAVSAAIQTTLTRMPSAQRTPSAVRNALVKLFPHLVVGAEYLPNGAIGFGVSDAPGEWAASCVSGQMRLTGTATVGPVRTGTDCRGG